MRRYIRTSLEEDSLLSVVEQIQPKYVFVSFEDGRECKQAMNFVNSLQEKVGTFLLDL